MTWGTRSGTNDGNRNRRDRDYHRQGRERFPYASTTGPGRSKSDGCQSDESKHLAAIAVHRRILKGDDHDQRRHRGRCRHSGDADAIFFVRGEYESQH